MIAAVTFDFLGTLVHDSAENLSRQDREDEFEGRRGVSHLDAAGGRRRSRRNGRWPK
jgi:hypothetical protein